MSYEESYKTKQTKTTTNTKPKTTTTNTNTKTKTKTKTGRMLTEWLLRFLTVQESTARLPTSAETL